MSVPKTIVEKIWEQHVVRSGAADDGAAGPDLLYVDLHLVHEVTSPQAFDGLRQAGRSVRRPDLTLATMDHNVPTLPGPVDDPLARTMSAPIRGAHGRQAPGAAIVVVRGTLCPEGGIVKRSRLPRRTSSLRRSGRVKAVNRARKAENHARAYGPAERRAFVSSLPCLVAMAIGDVRRCAGRVVNAHVKSGGASRKADAEFTVPLCWSHHCEQHNGVKTFERRYGLDLQRAAKFTDAAWRCHVAQQEDGAGHAGEDTEDVDRVDHQSVRRRRKASARVCTGMISILPANRLIASTLTPASFGVQGPGETTIRSGANT